MPPSSDFLTVATVSHVPQALATLASARQHSEHASFRLFVLDADPAALQKVREALGEPWSWLTLFGPYDVSHGRNEFLAAFEYYNGLEISCFAKHIAAAHVLRSEGAADVCVFGDSDILFTGDVRSVLGELAERAILLTPHRLTLTSEPMEHEFQMHGWINAGFLCLRRDHPNTIPMLIWLIDRISKRGFLAPHLGFSLDQKWVSALPYGYYDDCYLSRDPGINVAYWNIDERALANTGDRFSANGRELLFFHFSGFDHKNPALLSKHCDVRVIAGSPLERICKLYSAELEQVEAFRDKLAGLETIPFSKDSIDQRVRIGAIRNGMNLMPPSLQSRIRARIGRLIKSVLAR